MIEWPPLIGRMTKYSKSFKINKNSKKIIFLEKFEHLKIFKKSKIHISRRLPLPSMPTASPKQMAFGAYPTLYYHWWKKGYWSRFIRPIDPD
jgi:hypothetical protein